MIKGMSQTMSRRILTRVSRFSNNYEIKRTNDAVNSTLFSRSISSTSPAALLSSSTATGDAAAQKSNNPYIQGDETHFGFESVGVNEKEGRVRQVFESVADSYDVMNDLMSGGLHRYWKDQLLDMSAVASISKAIRQQQDQSSQRLNILDVAGGTGDVAFRFVEAAGCPERARSSGEDPITVTVCDINPEMLRVGEKRARERFGSSLLDGTKALSFVEGNAQSLDFPDNSFDLYTIAFGLRNVTDVVS
jgi:ubiquinone/menaquinone biosynthesis methyltransferase